MNKANNYKTKNKWNASGEIPFNIFNYSLFVLLGVLTFFPFWNVFVISISKYEEYSKSPFLIFPKQIYLETYKFIFSTDEILKALIVTIFITVVGTAYNMFVTVAAAYSLSKKDLPGRDVIFTLILIPMFFSGGLIPFYLLVKSLGLYNSLFAMILPGAVNTWYLIIIKNYFKSIPASLEESAKVDGANDVYILWKIILPISKPVIASFVLFYAVIHWNEWYNAMLFINNTKMQPLQLLLRNMIVKNWMSPTMLEYRRSSSMSYVTGDNVKMGVVIVATIPIVIVYPFLQKYFVKGVIVGSIKG